MMTRVVEAVLYVFGIVAVLMGIITMVLATSATGARTAAEQALGTLGVLYVGLPALAAGVISLGLGAIVTSVENLRRDTILVASTARK